ncbi:MULTISPECIES: three component ABC system middle component [Burkholderia]|uniref:three component ABC system middle component n=2 Tax=Burkholderia TaxID=32008 RepID=UPI0027E53A02|nr:MULTISPECIES: three component ABC system middle component [Burkholderia]
MVRRRRMSDTRASAEYRALFNPAFCAVLLREACLGAERESKSRDVEPLSFAASFLVLPAVLHEPIRRELPKTIATSFATWLAENPLLRSQFASLARVTKDITRKGLLFGSTHGALSLAAGQVHAAGSMKIQVPELDEAKSEMGQCLRGAHFMGRWLALAGNTTTTLALIGMRA